MACVGRLVVGYEMCMWGDAKEGGWEGEEGEKEGSRFLID